jgi:uncharacterized protein
MSQSDQSGHGINRREFIARSAAATVAASLAPGTILAAESRFHPIPKTVLPTRPFGRTGARIPLLTFGSGSRWLMYEKEEDALRVMNHAIDSGVIYIDTAHMYGDGESERRIGLLMPARRKDVLLQTKIDTRDKDLWWKHLELSLKRLNVEYVDTLLLHEMGNEADLAAIEAKGGPLDQLYKAKEQGLARWIGVSDHADCQSMVKFLRRHTVDMIQMPLNVATNAARDMGFEETSLPVAVEKGVGIIAMKVMGQDAIVGKHPQFDAATCLRYSLSLPITSGTVGMPKPEHLTANLETVKNFKPFTPEEMQEIKARAAREIQTSFHDFMRHHSDSAWA